MGSADWMPRNLDRRVEIIFPIEDEKIKADVKHILTVQLNDNSKAYYMNSQGEYEKTSYDNGPIIGAQSVFCNEALKNNKKDINIWQKRKFIPIMASEDFDE